MYGAIGPLAVNATILATELILKSRKLDYCDGWEWDKLLIA